MEHTSERRYPNNAELEHECSNTAGLAERMLCLLKPLLLAHQEAVLSRLDQVEQSVQEVSMDLEDLRTGFKIFFDEYRVEWDSNPGATRDQGYPKLPIRNNIPCDEYVKASLGPVNWANMIHALPHGSPRYESVSTADSNASEHEEEPRTPKPLHNAIPDSSYALKMSSESPNRPPRHLPLPTPSSSSPLISGACKLRHQMPSGFPRSLPDSSTMSSTSNTLQPIISEEDQQPPNANASLDPVNRTETINPLPNANPRSASVSTIDLNGQEHGEGPCTPKPLCDGAIHANAPIFKPKELVKLPHRFPLLTPSSLSPSVDRTHGHDLPLGFPRSPPDANNSTTLPSELQTIQVASDEEQKLSTSALATGDIAAAISHPPTNTLHLPHRTPPPVQLVTPPAGNHPTSSSPSTEDEDRMFSCFLNNEAMMMCTASAQEEPPSSSSPVAELSTFLEHTHATGTTAVPQPEPTAREGSVGSSEYDALAAESLLLADEHSHHDAQSPPIYHEDKHEHHDHLRTNGIRQPYIGLMSMKAEIQNTMSMSMVGTVDPTHIITHSPLSPLSSLSPSPEPQMFTSTHISAPVQSTRPKLLLKLNFEHRKSAATTRIRKRKPQPREGENEGVASTSTSDMRTERPTKRPKPSGSGVGELDKSTQAAIQAIAWPKKSEADNGFLRKVIQCDTCKHWYHYGCVGITRKEDGRLRPRAVFVCPVCEVHPKSALKRRPKKGKDSSICARHNCNRQQTESEYHVSRIIGRRNINADASGTAYRWLIKWSGYPVTKSTWETDDAISDPELLIKRFYQAVKREKGVEFDMSVKEPVLLKEAVKVGWL